MDTSQSNTAITDDVLHNPDHARLSAEAIAKALAHHNKRHSSEREQNLAKKQTGGKKQK